MMTEILCWVKGNNFGKMRVIKVDMDKMNLIFCFFSLVNTTMNDQSVIYHTARVVFKVIAPIVLWPCLVLRVKNIDVGIVKLFDFNLFDADSAWED